MRIAAEQAIAAPPETVFGRLADFPMFEERARRRHLPVERLTDDPPAWRIGAEWRGMSYDVELRVETVTPPEGYTAAVAARGVEGQARIRIVPDGDGSVASVAVDFDARGLAGRMLMQTLQFARPMLEGRLKGALAKLAAEIEGGAAAG